MKKYCKLCDYFSCQYDSNGDIAITHCVSGNNVDVMHEGNTNKNDCPRVIRGELIDFNMRVITDEKT